MNISNENYVPQHYLQVINEGDTKYFDLNSSGFTDYGGPSFTIFVAPPNSQFIDVVGDNANINESTFGHVFIGIKGINPQSNQYESVTVGYSAGNSYLTNSDNISFDDHNRYPEASSLTIAGQGHFFHNDLNNLFNKYNSMKSNSSDNKDYNLLSNNCIDFINDFLQESGIESIKLPNSPKEILKKIKLVASDYETPLIIDLNHDGVKTLSDSVGVVFKFKGNEKVTGWVDPNDALLVMDKNNDGVINDSSELFGDDYCKDDGSLSLNGFDGLLDIDSNNDSVVNHDDLKWHALKLWQDKNSDGKTQVGELLTLDEVGILSIKLNYSKSAYVDKNANQHKLISEVIWSDGRKSDVVDVWFKQKNKSSTNNRLAEIISSFNDDTPIELINRSDCSIVGINFLIAARGIDILL